MAIGEGTMEESKISTMTLEKQFLDSGWFPITRKVNREVREKFEDYISKREGDIKIIFNTNGGSMTESLNMVDLIRFYKKINEAKARAFVLGECSSAGLTILSQCDEDFREASPNSVFMFHSATFSPDIKHNLGLENALEMVRKGWGWCEKAIDEEMKGFGLTREKIMELRSFGEDNNYYVKTEEAQTLGIIKSIKEIPEL